MVMNTDKCPANEHVKAYNTLKPSGVAGVIMKGEDVKLEWFVKEVRSAVIEIKL